MPQVQTPKKTEATAKLDTASTTKTDTKSALRGKSFAEGEAELAPPKDGAAKKDGAEQFEPGTEVWAQRVGYHHAGVYVGNGEVVHVHAEPAEVMAAHAQGKAPVQIERTSIDEFANGAAVKAGPNKTTMVGAKAVKRALAKEGSTWAYDPQEHNCQHFSSWVVTGSASSPEGAKFKAAAAMAGANPHAALKDTGGEAKKAADSARDKAGKTAKKAKSTAKKALGKLF